MRYEIMEALALLKEHCESKDCDTCGMGDFCGENFANPPGKWELGAEDERTTVYDKRLSALLDMVNGITGHDPGYCSKCPLPKTVDCDGSNCQEMLRNWLLGFVLPTKKKINDDNDEGVN